VYVDGQLKITLKGDTIVAEFLRILEDYVANRFGVEPQRIRLPAGTS
jgi:(E)-4-hydroxy-3-methylbut-2-enyl-diphosphate synthase